MKHWTAYPKPHLVILRAFAALADHPPVSLEFGKLRHAQSARATFYRLFEALARSEDEEAKALSAASEQLTIAILTSNNKHRLIIERNTLTLEQVATSLLFSLEKGEKDNDAGA